MVVDDYRISLVLISPFILYFAVSLIIPKAYGTVSLVVVAIIVSFVFMKKMQAGD